MLELAAACRWQFERQIEATRLVFELNQFLRPWRIRGQLDQHGAADGCVGVVNSRQKPSDIVIRTIRSRKAVDKATRDKPLLFWTRYREKD